MNKYRYLVEEYSSLSNRWYQICVCPSKHDAEIIVAELNKRSRGNFRVREEYDDERRC